MNIASLPTMNRYLGTNPDQLIGQIRASAPDWFQQAENVADYAGGLVLRLHVNRKDQRQAVAALLYRRVASAFEAVVMLAERGMYTEGMTQRRSMLEALFALCALWKRPGFVAEFLQGDAHRLLKLYGKIKQLSPEIKDGLSPELAQDVVDAKIAELKVATSVTKHWSAFDTAQAAGLLDYYLTDYQFASEAAHHAAKDLERQIGMDATGEIDGFSWGAESTSPTELLSQGVEYMLMAIETTEAIFELGENCALGELTAKNNALPIS